VDLANFTLPSAPSLGSLGLPSLDLGNLPGPLGDLLGGPPQQPSIYPNLPKAQSAFTTKYGDPSFQNLLNTIPSGISTAFTNYDLQRVQQGQMPLNQNQTLGAIRTAVQQQPATPPPSEGFFGRALEDIKSMADIPHMVAGLAQTVQQLPEAPQKLSEVLGRGDLRDILAGLPEVPGLNLVPGVYTVSQLAKGGPGALLEHPVYSALDILPFAKEPVAALADTLAMTVPGVAERVTDAQSRIAAYQNEVMPDTGLTRAQETVAAGLPEPQVPGPFQLALQTSPRVQALIGDSRFMQNIAGRFGASARDVNQYFAPAEMELAAQRNVELPNDHPLVANAPDALRNAMVDMAQYRDVPEERMNELFDRLETTDPNNPLTSVTNTADVLASPDLTDAERAMVNDFATHVENFGQFATENWDNVRRDPISGDILTAAQFNPLQRARNNVTRADYINTIRNQVAAAQPGVLPDIDPTNLLDENITVGNARTMGQGLAYLFDKTGFDGQAIRDAVNAQGSTKADIATAVQDSLARPQVPAPTMSKQELIDAMQPHAMAEAQVGPGAERGTAYARILDPIRADDWINANRRWKATVGARTQFGHPQGDLIGDTLDRYATAQLFDRTTAAYSDRAVEAVRRSADRLERNTLPAIYVPQVQRTLYDPANQTGLYYEMVQDDPAAIAKLNAGQVHDVIRDNPVEARRAFREAVSQVADLRAQGFKPLFLSHVSPEDTWQITRPNLSDTLKTPQSIRERTFDTTPYRRNPSIAISHQAAQFMDRIMAEQKLPQFSRIFTKSQADATAEVQDLAERLAGGDPLKYQQEVNRLIGRRYVPWDPTTYFGGRARAGAFPNENVRYIDRATDIALKDMFGQHSYPFAKALDPVMNLFRTSVLGFSPRFHFHNIIGGLMLMATQDPRILPYMASHWSEIRDYVRSGEMHTIPGMPPAGIGFYPGEIAKDWLGKSTPMDRVRLLHEQAGTNTVLRWLGEAQGVTGSVWDKIRAGAQKSYQLNQIVDDFYRAGSYLYGRDRALTAGLSDAEANARGIALVRKVLPQWDRMTNFERNIVRTYVPFYSFTKFLVDYAARYPFDHPVRASVMASLARNEAADFGNWLPTDFARMFFLGKPDQNGNLTAFNPGGLNPFQDIAQMTTIGGILGRANPVILAVMRSLGVDPTKGYQDLYPDVSYDPGSGQLKPSNPNFLSSLVQSIVPQSQFISALVGRNENFAHLAASNPEAAMTQLRSAIGLPAVFRQVNPYQAAFKAEVQRQTVQDQVRNEALRTGNWSRAMQYPGLRPFFTKLGQAINANPKVAQAYQSQVQAQTVGDILPTALLQRNLPVG